MQVKISYTEQQLAKGRNVDIDRLCHVLSQSHGLDMIDLRVDSGVILVKGFCKDGKSAETAIGFSTIKEKTAATIAAFTIGLLRKKMYGITGKVSRRQHVGQILVPDEWFSQ